MVTCLYLADLVTGYFVCFPKLVILIRELAFPATMVA